MASGYMSDHTLYDPCDHSFKKRLHQASQVSLLQSIRIRECKINM